MGTASSKPTILTQNLDQINLKTEGLDVTPTKITREPSHESKFFEIQKALISEYPWLNNVYESMSVSDCRLPDCPMVYVNDDFEKMTLYSREEILGRNCRFLQGRLTNRETVRRIREAIDSGKELEVEILNYRKDGSPFWNNFLMLPVHKNPKKPQTSKVIYFLAIQKDISLIKLGSKLSKEWLSAEVAMWFDLNGWEGASSQIIDSDLNGLSLLSISEDQLINLGFITRNQRAQILEAVQGLRESKESRIKEREDADAIDHDLEAAVPSSPSSSSCSPPPSPSSPPPSPSSTAPAPPQQSGERGDVVAEKVSQQKEEGNQAQDLKPLVKSDKDEDENRKATTKDGDKPKKKTPKVRLHPPMVEEEKKRILIDNELGINEKPNLSSPKQFSLRVWRRKKKDTKLAVKCYFAKDIILLRVPKKISLTELSQKVNEAFGLNVSLKFEDKEGDAVRITSNEDLAFAIKHSNDGTIHLLLEKMHLPVPYDIIRWLSWIRQPIFVVDGEAVILFANPSTELLLKQSNEDLINRKLTASILPDLQLEQLKGGNVSLRERLFLRDQSLFACGVQKRCLLEISFSPDRSYYQIQIVSQLF